MRPADRRTLVRVVLVLAVPMALVALIPALVGLAIAQHDRTMIRKTVAAQDKIVDSILQVRRTQIRQIASTDQRLCAEIETLKRQIRITVARSNKTLPTLSYYREHPDELAAARAYNRQALHDFAPRNCTKLPSQRPPVTPQPKPAPHGG